MQRRRDAEKSNGRLSPKELRTLKGLRTPARIQRFLDDMPYHHAKTAWSPRLVLKHKQAHCLEGALFAAAALRVNGFPALLWDLESVRDDDHVLAVFQVNKHWGAIGKSNFAGLRYREPVYVSLRELAMSYFDSYFNLLGERTLRAFATDPVDLKRFDAQNWMTTGEDLWYIAEHLCEIPHTRLLTSAMEKRLTRIGMRNLAAGQVGRQ
jgi:hypothetical protein